jgi:hypothetical protein
MKKTLTGLCIILCLSISIYAQQNARVQSMGNTDIVPDISRTIYYNPAYMNDYRNQAQISFDSPMIGIKSLSDVLSIGAILNRGLILNPIFYSDGLSLLDSDYVSSTEYSPHILFGINMSSLKLGADIYWEHSSYSQEISTSTTTTDDDRSINNFGFLLGGDFTVSSANLAIHAGMGFPVIHAKSGSTTTTETKSDKGLSLRIGAEVQAELLKMMWTFGADWNHLSYQFNVAGTKQSDNSANVVTPYLGFKTELADKLLFVAKEKLQLAYYNSTDADTIKYYISGDTISCGFEKQFANAWIFDSLALRGGLEYSITYTGTDYSTATRETKTDYVTTYGPATPYLGFGVSKAFFTFDLVVDPAAWAGLFNGPDVARATMSVKF